MKLAFRLLEPDRLEVAPLDEYFSAMSSIFTDEEMLYAKAFASSIAFDQDFARLVDDHERWRARVDEAAKSTLVCLCSACEMATTNGTTIPHT